jgi:hypothetical protein
MFDLAFIWAGLIAFAVLAYVLFDGFDLGIGILFPFLGARSNARPGHELRSRPCGTATRPGWCWAAAADGGLSRSPTPW